MAENEDQSILKVLVELTDEISEPLHGIQERVESFDHSLEDLSAAFAGLFGSYEILEHIIEPAASFQTAQTGIALAAGLSAEKLDELKEQAYALSVVLPRSAEDIAGAQEELYKTLGNIDTVKDVIDQATKMGEVMGGSATEGAQLLATTYQNLGDLSTPVADKMQIMANKLTYLLTVFPRTGASASQTANSFARVAAATKSFGVSVDDTLALMSELARLHVGVGGRGAGIYAQEIITALGELDTHGVPKLEKYGLIIAKTRAGQLELVKTLRMLADMPAAKQASILGHLGERGQYLALLLPHLKDLIDVQKNYAAITAQTGEEDKAVAVIGATLNVKIQELKNSFISLADSLGTFALPQITALTDLMTDAAKALLTFLDKHPKWSVFIADVVLATTAALALGGAIKIVSVAWGLLNTVVEATGLISVVKNLWLITSLLGDLTLESLPAFIGLLFGAVSPVGWILLGVAAVAVISYEIYKHWDAISNAIGKAVEYLHDFIAYGLGISKGGTLDTLLGNALGQSAYSSELDLRSRGTPFIGGAPNSQLTFHYAPTIHHSGSAQGLKEVLQEHGDDMLGKIEEQQRQQQRLAFKDPTLAPSF
jgi:TP901 family phage tail tape measure protein